MKTNHKRNLWIILLILVFDKLFKLLLLKYTDLAKINSNIGLGFVIAPQVFWVGSAVLVSFIIIWYRQTNAFALVLLLAGALANISDRFVWGGVVDYLKVPGLFTLNITDVLICVSIVIVILKLVRNQISWPKFSNLMS